jgi:low temperature requirement protein LtrA
MGLSDQASPQVGGAAGVRQGLRAWFLQPPRPHGEVIAHRTVSYLELFYDLVYVVLIARTAHHLAEHVSWRGLAEFAVVFGLIWVAWLNGTLYQELHGREDGRSRSYIFMQMFLLAVLAVYASDAAGGGGRAFALTYAALLTVLAWQWYTVQRHDEQTYRRPAGAYLAGMLVSIALMAASAALPSEARLIVWTGLVLGHVAGGVVLLLATPTGGLGVTIAESLVERFGLFIIIVLGEVVVGVVSGLSESDRNAATLATGMIGLCIGYGIWWSYFDLVGRRLPRPQHRAMALWVYSHLPLAMAVVAAGAAMVSLVAHAGDVRAPAPTAWLLSGATATVLIMLITVMRSLDPRDAKARLNRPALIVLGTGAFAVLVSGWARPPSWMLVLVVALILAATWLFLFIRHAQD